MAERIPRRWPLRRLAASESAATAIEYGLIAGMIALAVAAVLPDLGSRVQALFASVAGML